MSSHGSPQDGSRCREFYLAEEAERLGVRVLAVGVVLPSGVCVLEWLTEPGGLEVRPCLEYVEAAHGGMGRTLVLR